MTGDENYYIDKVTEHISENILTGEEKEFNQSILYGKETDIATIISEAKIHLKNLKYENNLNFILMIYFAFSCYNNQAIKSNYNFSNVKSIEINAIEDHPNLRGSGSMISNIISYSFLNFGFDGMVVTQEN